MATNFSAIADNEVKCVRSSIEGLAEKDLVTVKTLYKEKTIVLTLLRRFGCKLCRFPAQELRFSVLFRTASLLTVNCSQLKPELDANGIGLVAIGLQSFGLEDFLEGQYFAGDLYLDINKGCYVV